MSINMLLKILWVVKVHRYLVIPVLFYFLSSCNSNIEQTTPLIGYVDPFMGVDNEGVTLPGPTLPFSMARPGPDCPIPNWTTGYRSYKPIDGFSQNHLSGTGGPGGLLIF